MDLFNNNDYSQTFGDDMMLADRQTTVTTQAENAAAGAEMPAPFEVDRVNSGFMPGMGTEFMPGMGDSFMPGIGTEFMPGMGCVGCGDGMGALDFSTTKGKMLVAGLAAGAFFLYKKMRK